MSGVIGLLVVVAIVAVFIVGLVVAERGYARVADSKDLARLSDWVDGPLYFRRMTESDLDFVTEASVDPITMTANGLAVSDPVTVREQYQKLLTDSWPTFMVGVERTTNQPVGWTSLQASPVDLENSLSIGLTLHPDFRGNDYGRQLLGAAIASLRGVVERDPPPMAIFVGTGVDNYAMQRIMTKLGYQAEAATRPYHAPNGEVLDSLWYQCGSATAEPRLR